MIKEDIDQIYLGLANTLEMDFFKIVPEKVDGEVVGQHRELRKGKSESTFNPRHGQLWKDHETELIAYGYMQPRVEQPPTRDLLAELADRVEALEAK